MVEVVLVWTSQVIQIVVYHWASEKVGEPGPLNNGS